MWQKMKMGMYRFMQGRYGFDSLSNFMLGLGMIFVIVNLVLSFTPLCNTYLVTILSLLAWLMIILSYVRTFSKNYEKRYAENEWFMKKTAGIREKIRKRKAMNRIKRTHHIYSCPSCNQKIKIPKGKGNIIVSCPKCRMEFAKKS